MLFYGSMSELGKQSMKKNDEFIFSLFSGLRKKVKTKGNAYNGNGNTQSAMF